MPADSVLKDYKTRLEQADASLVRATSAHSASRAALIAACILFVLLLIRTGQGFISVWLVPLSLLFVAGTVQWFRRRRREWLRLFRLRAVRERALARVEDRWQGTGSAGEEFHVLHHVYEADLQVLGAGSLFENLCTARTGIGRRYLAKYLLEPCSLERSRERQAAVRELAAASELRERVALLGRYDSQESSWEIFAEWLAVPAAAPPVVIRLIAFAAVAIAVILNIMGVLSLLPWGVLRQGIIPAVATAATIAWTYRRQTTRLNDVARKVGTEIGVVREGMELIAQSTFLSAKLRGIQQRLADGQSTASLRRLERLINALDECENPAFYMAAQVLMVRTQLCFGLSGGNSSTPQR